MIKDKLIYLYISAYLFIMLYAMKKLYRVLPTDTQKRKIISLVIFWIFFAAFSMSFYKIYVLIFRSDPGEFIHKSFYENYAVVFMTKNLGMSIERVFIVIFFLGLIWNLIIYIKKRINDKK